MKPALVALALLLAIAVPSATAAPARVLTKSTLDRFLKDFPAMMVELEALGEETVESFESYGGDEEPADFSAESIRATLAAAIADEKVKAILRRYGWGDTFVDVYFTIVSCYSYLAFEEVFNAYPMPEYKQYMEQLRATVHPDDIAIVKANKAAIDEALGMED
jgi:hypothetical protein